MTVLCKRIGKGSVRDIRSNQPEENGSSCLGTPFCYHRSSVHKITS